MDARRSNGSSLQIPVIDISEASAADTAGQLVDAVARYGFVFVRGEGIGFTKQTLDNAFALVRPKQLLDVQTILMMWIVTKILLINHRRETKMCYPRQCKPLPLLSFPITELVSHILPEYRLVVNALRNIGPKDPYVILSEAILPR